LTRDQAAFDPTAFPARSFRVLAVVAVLGFGTTAGGFPFHRKPAMPNPPVDRVLKVGDPAPDFSLPAQDGKIVSLNDFRGKWLVLYFCPFDQTPGCTLESHNFERDLPEYEKVHAAVVGVSPDSPKRHKDFSTEQELTFQLLTDRKRKVAKRYGAWRRLALILKHPERATFLVDPRGRVAKIWLAADARHQSTDVLAALAELEKK
jgi:peroxiredoxin Q/BCP